MLNREIGLNLKMDPIQLMEKEMLRRNYSLKTIKTYNYYLNKFLNFLNKDFKKVKKQDTKNYLDKLIDKKVSGSTINVNLNAIKFLFEEILNKKLTLKIKYSKVPKTLPIFLTKEEVVILINSIENIKHLNFPLVQSNILFFCKPFQPLHLCSHQAICLILRHQDNLQ